MNTVTIRINPKDKEELLRLMAEKTKFLYEAGEHKRLNKIMNKGYSMAEFIRELIDIYKEATK